MVLHDIPYEPLLLVEVAPFLDPDALGNGELDVVNIAVIPEVLEN